MIAAFTLAWTGTDRGLRRTRREPLLASSSTRRSRSRRTGSTGRRREGRSTFLGQAIKDPNPRQPARVLEPLADEGMVARRDRARARARPRRPTSRTRRDADDPDTDFVARHPGRRHRRHIGSETRSAATRCSGSTDGSSSGRPRQGVYPDGWMGRVCELHPVRRPARHTRGTYGRPLEAGLVRQGRSQHGRDPGRAGRDLAERRSPRSARVTSRGDGVIHSCQDEELSLFRRHRRPGARR